jgi:preprotein translocase subunit YajC
MLQIFLMFFQDAGDEPSAIMSFLPFILIMVIIYFLMMRPQLKKQKDKQKMVEELKKGDNVITRGGIHGKVVGFTDENKTAIVKVDDNVKLNLDKGAIELVIPVGGKAVESKK